jgi:hypothetical protein
MIEVHHNIGDEGRWEIYAARKFKRKERERRISI